MRDGQLSIEYRGRAVPWREIAGPAQAKASEPTKTTKRPERPMGVAPKPKWVPAADHPWREAGRQALIRRNLAATLAAQRTSLALPCASP